MYIVFNWMSKKWASYWYYIHLRQIIRFDKDKRYIYHNFNENFLTGQPEIFPQDIFPIFGLSFTFNTLLTELYVEKNHSEEKINYVKTLGTDLLAVVKTICPDYKVIFSNRKGTSKDLGKWLEEIRDVAVETNKEWAGRLGINQSAAITCVKPSGTVSQLVDSASGIHPRFSKHYIRRVRSDKKDPLAIFMESQGFPVEQDLMSQASAVFSFPVKAPETSVTVKQVGAMEQLQLWKTYQNHWCEHKPSITVYYTDDEFLQVAQWIWENFDLCSGISLLPYSDHVYQQAPYEDIDADKYDELVAAMPEGVDWEDLGKYEQEDNTTGSQELACTAGVCEAVDIVSN